MKNSRITRTDDRLVFKNRHLKRKNWTFFPGVDESLCYLSIEDSSHSTRFLLNITKNETRRDFLKTDREREREREREVKMEYSLLLRRSSISISHFLHKHKNQFQFLRNRCSSLPLEFDWASTNIDHPHDNNQIRSSPWQSHPSPSNITSLSLSLSFFLSLCLTLYRSMIGIRRGPSILRLNEGRRSR